MRKSSFIISRFGFVFLILSLTVLPFFALKFFPDFTRLDSYADTRPIHQIYESIDLFTSDELNSLNSFEIKDGLFSFEHSNRLVVKENKGIYYLEELKTNQVLFQIFENKPEINFDDSSFDCYQYKGVQSLFVNREVCFSKLSTHLSDPFIFNLRLFGSPMRFFKRHLRFFAARDLIDSESFDYQHFLSRAEAVEMILKLRYPGKDFSEYDSDCFEDIEVGDPRAGFYCYAKKNGILVGIGGNLYPNQSINLFGLLKILFLTFEVDDYSFNENFMKLSLFDQMQTIHIAYPLIAKAYYEGLFTNLTEQIHWSNRHIYKGEALEIIHRFYEWQQGRKIHNYSPVLNVDSSFIYFKNSDYEVSFLSDDNESFDEDDVLVEVRKKSFGLNTQLYFLDRGGIYYYLHTLDGIPVSRVQSAFIAFDDQRLKGKMIIILNNGTKKVFKVKQKKIQFDSFKDKFLEEGYVEQINQLDFAGLLPNVTSFEDPNNIPRLKLYMLPEGFVDLYVHRTGNNRYPAFLELHYPNGDILQRSVLIKTRGNANRGYIKSGFTIEAFKEFDENSSFSGDELLENSDEFKLRGFINEESMIREKLLYQSFSDLGYPAPRFFDAVMEVNGVPMGLYQITESIKKPFFKSRKIDMGDYYYARNSDSQYNTNLSYHETDELTLSQYKIKKNPERLLEFIMRLTEEDPTLIDEINVQNVFDYAMTVFLMQANDSLTHNFYVYYDEAQKKWNIFPWDADDALYEIGRFNIWDFLKFVQKKEGTYNQLIYYTFQQIGFEEIQSLMLKYLKNWNENVDLNAQIDTLVDQNKHYYRYDNRLWNGRYLERKKYQFDTLGAIRDMQKSLSSLFKLEEQGIGLK